MSSDGPIVGLLPVRNGERDLPRWLTSASRVVDAVVALDDGSTDRTAELLANSGLVQILLQNPLRPDSGGWDDGANRRRLLEAVGRLDPSWIISLDADEELDPEDAEALRRFLLTDGLPACAYGLRHYRMWTGETYDPDYRIVFRVFAYEDGQHFPEQRLHFTPIPTSIPAQRLFETTIRLKHHGSSDEERVRSRAEKYAAADPHGEFTVEDWGLSGVPTGPLPAWERRAQGTPVLAGAERTAVEDDDPGRPRLVCLLPARNCADDLPGYFRSVERFADAVVALDDGSTDGTGDVLRSHPLVKVLLSEPRRDTYAGWDDARNRDRLLDAAEELKPRWVLFLDADERIDASDADALLRFIDEEADPACAYGFRVHRMIDGTQTYDQDHLAVVRLFAWEPGQQIEDKRLHPVPVPTSIPASRWVPTTLRIQHLGSATDERRRQRFEKYREADPDNEFQSYSTLLEPPGVRREWEARDPELPVADLTAEVDGHATALSVIVIAQDDVATIGATLRSIVGQEVDEPFETICVVSGSPATASVVRDGFPNVRLVELDDPVLPGGARNAGLAVARGDYVVFVGAHVELTPGFLVSTLHAHLRGYPMVAPATVNGTRTHAGWASYFLDHAQVLPGRTSEAVDGPPGSCSYERDALLGVGGFSEDLRAGEDTVVNRELVARGYRVWFSSGATRIHVSRCRTLRRLLAHHYRRGRSLGQIAVGEGGGAIAAARHTVSPLVRYRRIEMSVEAHGAERERRMLRRVRLLVLAGAGAANLGFWIALRRRHQALKGHSRPERAQPGQSGARNTKSLRRRPACIGRLYEDGVLPLTEQRDDGPL